MATRGIEKVSTNLIIAKFDLEKVVFVECRSRLCDSINHSIPETMSLFPIALYRTVLAMECFVSITINHMVRYLRHPQVVILMSFFHIQNFIIQMVYLFFFVRCHEIMLDWVDADLPVSYINHSSYLYTCNIPWHHYINKYCIFLFGPFLNIYNLYTTVLGRRQAFETNVFVILLIASQWYIIVMLGLPNFLSDVVVTISDGVHTIPPNLDCNVA